jgi:hypothetical protein
MMVTPRPNRRSVDQTKIVSRRQEKTFFGLHAALENAPIIAFRFRPAPSTAWKKSTSRLLIERPRTGVSRVTFFAVYARRRRRCTPFGKNDGRNDDCIVIYILWDFTTLVSRRGRHRVQRVETDPEQCILITMFEMWLCVWIVRLIVLYFWFSDGKQVQYECTQNAHARVKRNVYNTRVHGIRVVWSAESNLVLYYAHYYLRGR